MRAGLRREADGARAAAHHPVDVGTAVALPPARTGDEPDPRQRPDPEIPPRPPEPREPRPAEIPEWREPPDEPGREFPSPPAPPEIEPPRQAGTAPGALTERS